MLLALLLAASIHDSAAYQEATALYQRVELEKALVLLQRSVPEASTDAERSQVYAWIGLIEGQLGHMERCRAALRQAATLDPHVELPAPAPPEVVSILDEVRAETNAARAAAAEVAAAESASAGPSPALIAMIAGGGLVVVGGAVIALGLDTVYRQSFEAEFQQEAIETRDRGYVEYVVGGVLAVAGVAALGVGAALLLLEE